MEICSILERLLNIRWFPTFWKCVFVVGLVAICKIITIECDRMFAGGPECAIHVFLGLWWMWILVQFVDLNGFLTKLFFLRDYLTLEEFLKREKEAEPEQKDDESGSSNK